MASNVPEAMTVRPVVHSPASPTELLTYLISHCRHPTTVIVGCARQDFEDALTQDAVLVTEPGTDTEVENQAPMPKHPLLQQTLLQVAVSRHLRIVFTTSVTHFRAWTSVFSPLESGLPSPPTPQSSDNPLLLVYGFVELHRDTSEWSAQGIGASAASLVEAAARYGFRAVVMEPKARQGMEENNEEDTPGAFGDEEVPLLKGIALREDGTWAGRTVEIRKVLSRWFEFEQ